MAYVPGELRLVVPNLTSNSGSPQIWSLQGTDAAGSVDNNNFISDALQRGMRKGDIVLYTQWDSLTTRATLTAITVHAVAAVASTGADLMLAGATLTGTNLD